MTTTATPAAATAADLLVDLGLGADVDAGGGLIEDEHARLRRERPGQEHLLLVAAAERRDAALGVRGHDAEALDERARDPATGGPGAPARARESCWPRAVRTRFSADGRGTTRPSRLRSSGSMTARRLARRRPRRADIRRRAPQLQACPWTPRRPRAPATRRDPARAHQPGEAQDLPGAHRERDRRASAHDETSTSSQHDGRVRGGLAAARSKRRSSRPTMQRRRGARRSRARRSAGWRPTSPSRSTVTVLGDREHLLEEVADVDDADARSRSRRMMPNRTIALAGGQPRGGLVHDEDAGVARERLDDLGELLVGDR